MTRPGRYPRIEFDSFEAAAEGIALERESRFDAFNRWLEGPGLVRLGLGGCLIFAFALPIWLERSVSKPLPRAWGGRAWPEAHGAPCPSSAGDTTEDGLSLPALRDQVGR